MARQSIDGAPQPKESRGKEAPGGDPANTKKAALAIAGIVVAGVLIAWSMGYFDGTPTYKGKPVQAGGETLTPAAEKQIQERKRLEALPEGHPQKPQTAGG